MQCGRRTVLLAVVTIGCGDEMASYPLSPNKFPESPNKFPVAPKAYPGTVAAFPAGGGPAPLLLTPESGDTFEDQDTVILHATIPSGAPAVTNVEFYQGVTLLGTAAASPWEYIWEPVSTGSYSVTAKANYADATTGTSAAASITVAAARSFVPTDLTQTKFWADPTHDASITITAGRVQTITRYRDNVSFTGDMTQGTAAARPILGRLRGKQALFFGTGTSERLVAAVTGTVGFPHTLFVVVRPVSHGSTSYVLSTAGIGRVRFGGTTYPRTRTCESPTDLASTKVASTSELITFLCNNTASEARVNTVTVNGPGASAGASGLTTDFCICLNSGANSEKMSVGDVIIAVGALSAGERTQIESELMAKWHLADPVAKFMVVGDSIARGFGSADSNGYRALNWTQWSSKGKIAGRWLEEIGPAELGSFGGDCHYGIDGKGINYMRANLPALIGTGAEQFAPDVILLDLGINNAASAAGEAWAGGTGAGSTIDEYKLLVGDIWAKLPNCIIIPTNLPPNSNGTTETNRLAFNSDLPAALAALEVTHSKQLVKYFWDTSVSLGGVYTAGLMSDATHPNDAGYQAKANAMRPAIVRAFADL